MSDPRHSRQVRLAELGDAGQVRIESLEATIAGEGVAAIVEARYLAGAGVRKIACASDEVGAAARAVDARVAIALAFPSTMEDGAPSLALKNAGARDVALGAWRALDLIRHAIKGGIT